MNSAEIFASRLRNARIINGFSMDELVNKMGNIISKMTISKYEKSQLAPNSSVLISLSRALNQPVDYFFRPFTISVENIKFRKKSKLSIKQEKSISKKIADLIERYITIEEICNASVKFVSPFSNIILSSTKLRPFVNTTFQSV